MPFKKGTKKPAAGGRKKGTPNKVSGELREMILQALSNAGGVEYLTARAKYNPVAFLTLIGKVLPIQVTGDKDAPLQVVVSVSDARL